MAPSLLLLDPPCSHSRVHFFPPLQKRPKDHFPDVDSSLSITHKLLRSFSSKLKRLCQRIEVDADEIGLPPCHEQVGGRPAEAETFVDVFRSSGAAHEELDVAENEPWRMVGCFGLQGLVARLCYVGKHEATDASWAGRKQNDSGGGAAILRRNQEGARGGQLGKDNGYVEQVEFLQEIGMGNCMQPRADQLKDNRWSRRQQGGCFANGGIERLKDWGNRRGEKGGRDEAMETELNENNGNSRRVCEEGEFGGREKDRPPLRQLEKQQHCGCFAKEKLNCNRKLVNQQTLHTELPDEVIELCLARMSFSTMAKARLVCRKWRELTMSPHFLATREKFCPKKPWLLLFGLSRDGVSTGEIHALDPAFDRWRSIRADMLSGKFLFSVASYKGLIYIVGGCSSSPNRHGKPGKGRVKTDKAVLAYNPLIGSWKKVCSMGVARAMAVAAVFETRDGKTSKATSRRSFARWQHGGSEEQIEMINSISDRERGLCILGASAEISHTMDEQESGEWAARTSSSNPILHSFSMPEITNSDDIHKLWNSHPVMEKSHENTHGYGLIVVGGQGVWNEPLSSAEVYDPATNTWREIAKLPPDHGVTCAGVMCNGLFYAYSETDNLAAYDFDLNLWTSIQVSNTFTRLHEYIPRLVSCKGRVFLLGVAWGQRETHTHNGVEKVTRILWEFNPSLDAWLQISSHPDAPLDWNAVFLSNGDQIFGVEMFKIFGQGLDFVTVCDLSRPQVKWERVSRMRIGNNLDVSSCIAKTAVMVLL